MFYKDKDKDKDKDGDKDKDKDKTQERLLYDDCQHSYRCTKPYKM